MAAHTLFVYKGPWRKSKYRYLANTYLLVVPGLESPLFGIMPWLGIMYINAGVQVMPHTGGVIVTGMPIEYSKAIFKHL